MSFQHLSQLDLRQICAFMMLVQSGNNFSEAAKRLGIKQPPFSQRIQALEKALSVGKNSVDVKLLDRSKQPAELTEAGKVFLAEIEPALMQLEQAITQAQRASQGYIGHLTIGIHNSIANSSFPKVLQEFRRRFPEVKLDLREVTTLQEIPLLINHQLDLVFHRSDEPVELGEDSPLQCLPILQESFVLVMPQYHPLAKQTQVTLNALKNDLFILPSLDVLPFYQHIITQCQQAGFEPQILQTIHAKGIVTLLSLVAAGLGVSILPHHVQMLHREGIVCRPIQDITLSRHLTAVWQQDNLSIVLHNFLKVMQDVMRLPSVL